MNELNDKTYETQTINGDYKRLYEWYTKLSRKRKIDICKKASVVTYTGYDPFNEYVKKIRQNIQIIMYSGDIRSRDSELYVETIIKIYLKERAKQVQ